MVAPTFCGRGSFTESAPGLTGPGSVDKMKVVMYAIVRTGGKQYRVEEGSDVTVERLPAEEGATVELDDVLLIADNGDVTLGTPAIEGARVLAHVEENGRAKKIIVFKYKAKVRTRKKTGHRQSFTRLAVREILRPGQQPKEEAKPRRRRRKTAAEAPAEAPTAEAAPSTVEAPAPPKRRTRRAETPAAEAKAPPKRRTRRAETPAAEAKAPTKRRTRRPATPAAEAEIPPKRRARRKAPETGEAETPAASEGETKPKTPRRRSTRRKTGEGTE